MSEFTVLSGTANRALAEAVARELGVEPGRCLVSRFPDGEIAVQLEEPVRHKHVYLLQPTSPPVNDHLVELLLLADACRRSAAAAVTAIIPYFGYARSDKRDGRRKPIGASMVAHLLESMGINHVVMVDLHRPQIEGFFHASVDNLTAVPTLCQALRDRLPAEPVVIVAPDAGRVKAAASYAQRLGGEMVVLDKERLSGTQTKVAHLVGDVRDRRCLIIDDMIATGGTLAESAKALLEAGARPGIYIAATHGLFLNGAREKLDRAEIAEIWVTDTVQYAGTSWPKLHTVSVAPLIAGAISRFMVDGSLDDLF